jgi:hypothetical protein
MVEASEELVARGIFEDKTAPNAAAKRQEVRGAELVDEAMVTGKDDTEELTGVEILAGKGAKLAEDADEGLLGLINDEDGASEGREDMVGPASAQGLEPTPAIVGLQGYGEEVAELSVEVHGAGLGMFDVTDDEVSARLQALVEQPEGDALAGAWIAGDHDVATVGDAELDTAEEGIDGRAGVKGFDRHVRAKGIELESVQGLQLGAHGVSSVSLVCERSWGM